MKNSQDNLLSKSLHSTGQQTNPKDAVLSSSCSQDEFFEELTNSVKLIGFKKVNKIDEKIIYGIDNSKNEFEKLFFVYDLELFEKSGRKYQCLRSYFSKKGKFYAISKTYLEYILALIAKINERLLIGAFFYLNSTCEVYFEVSQIMPKYLSFLRRSTSRLTDELVSAMTYSKTLYFFIQYLKSLKNHLKRQLKKGIPLPAGLSQEIQETMTRLVNEGHSEYLESRAKEVSLGRAFLFKCIDYDKETQLIREFKKNTDLVSLFNLNKYCTADDNQVKIPVYIVGQGSHENTFYSSKIQFLAEKILKSPKILNKFQDSFISLVKTGFRVEINKIPEKILKVCQDDVKNFIIEPIFYGFYVTSDNRILFAYDEDRQLCNSLVKLEGPEEVADEEVKVVEKVFEASSLAVELSCLDLSIIHIDIDKFIGKVEN